MLNFCFFGSVKLPIRLAATTTLCRVSLSVKYASLSQPFPLCDTATVRKILVKMNRIDAVNIIDRVLMVDKGESSLTTLTAKGATKPIPQPRVKQALGRLGWGSKSVCSIYV